MTATLAASVSAEKLPTDPVGGEPPVGSKPSVKDLSDRVTYQRAFEAVVWSMPALAQRLLQRSQHGFQLGL
ncbi:MAG: hypothetical protein WBB95_28710 [Pseudomonas sp.]|uniref:hypothetical protein n=1 Tax=Pseudomonas sp. TaxID=306 RepID=UPI003C71C87D